MASGRLLIQCCGLLLLSAVSSQVPDWYFVERETEYGSVRGYSVPFALKPKQSMRLEVFLGIPYVTPPIGEKRWARPVPPPAWKPDIFNATDFSPACSQPLWRLHQYSFNETYNRTSEDCVSLNIYSPRNTSAPSERSAVLLWIHGGANRYGSGEEYDGRILAEMGVVVVTINYRLGVIGFMSTDDEVCPGNFALLDQVAAIQWVHRNIHYFGGDPGRITLFGNSAGGSHCGLHLFSPLTRGLLSGVIPQSGSPFSPWAIYRPPFSMRPRTEELARRFGCSDTSSSAILTCLRGKSADELSKVTLPGFGFNSPFIPRVDNYYINDIPEVLAERGEFHQQVALMTGTVPNEFSYTGSTGITWDEKNAMLQRWSTRFDPFELTDYVTSAIQQEYDNPTADGLTNRNLYLEMRTDNGYVAPHDVHARWHSSRQASTWLYAFVYRSDNYDHPPWTGVMHQDELYYVFGAPFWNLYECPWPCRNTKWYNRITWTEEDRRTSLTMMRLWSNFAKYRNPTSEDISSVWPSYNFTAQPYLHINGSQPQASSFYKYRRVTFWNRYLFPLLQRIQDERRQGNTAPPPVASANKHSPIQAVMILLFTWSAQLVS